MQQSRLARYKAIVPTILLITSAINGFAQPPDPEKKMSPKEINVLVDSLSNALKRNYVYPDKADLMAKAIHKRAKTGAYAKAQQPTELAVLLSQDLQTAHKDPHMLVMFAPERARILEGHQDRGSSKEEQDRFLRNAREMNFDFSKVEILPGNIGYLRWNSFMHLVEESKPIFESAFGFVRNCSALIIDMRYNGGGSPDMVIQTLSYFFNERIPMNHIIMGRDTTWQITDPTSTSIKMNMPVYILTSKGTFSGAEDFTYAMKVSKRATIVGDTTGGGAHPTGDFSIGQGFIAMIPNGRSWNPVTKTDWEGTGVWPDIYMNSENALPKVQALVLSKQLVDCKDEWLKNKLQFNYNCLLPKLVNQDSLKMSASTLLKFCGDFVPTSPGIPPLSIVVKNDAIYRHVDHVVDAKLLPISATKFVYDDDSGRMMEFKIGAEGVANEIVLSRIDGTFSFKRKQD